MKKRGFKAFLCKVVVITIVLTLLFIMIDFMRFPECYLSTWKYQLENDIKAGKAEAIEYYNRTYIAHGKELFEN